MKQVSKAWEFFCAHPLSITAYSALIVLWCFVVQVCYNTKLWAESHPGGICAAGPSLAILFVIIVHSVLSVVTALETIFIRRDRFYIHMMYVLLATAAFIYLVFIVFL